MKAVVQRAYGTPDVLELRDIPTPVPADNDVLVRVHAVEVTKGDCELRAFRYAVKWFWFPLRLALGIRRPRQPVPGSYFAGTIAALGKDVTDWRVGDAVFGSAGFRRGACAEFLAVPAAGTLVPKPATMDFNAAAAVPLGGLNALHFLSLAAIRRGERVLLNGAGGSIGTHAVQIAKALGAEVTAVDAAHKEALVRRLGADAFIDYRRATFTDRPDAWDVIFDMQPGSDVTACLRALRPGGRYLSGNPRFATLLRAASHGSRDGKSLHVAFAREMREELADLKDMIEAGDIVSIVDRSFPPAAVADAHRRVESEARLGAIVLDMTQA